MLATRVRLLRSTTLTVPSPSPTQSSLRSGTTTRPVGPETAALARVPVKPATAVSTARVSMSTTCTAPLVRSARKYHLKSELTAAMSTLVDGFGHQRMLARREEVLGTAAGLGVAVTAVVAPPQAVASASRTARAPNP